MSAMYAQMAIKNSSGWDLGQVATCDNPMGKWVAKSADMRIAVAARPSTAYLRRSELTAQLHEAADLLQANQGEDFRPPAVASLEMAESFINELPNDAATKSRLAVSDEGEINFSFEQGANCFRVIICDDAALSYYGLVDGREYFGDGVPLSDFPYMKLVQAL